MSNLKGQLNRNLTARDTAVVVGILAILAAAGYGAYQFTAAKLLAARVQAAVPTMLGELRELRGRLVNAIDAYKARFGVYPPDHVIRRQPLTVDPITNTLLYELAGVVYNPTNKTFQIPGVKAVRKDEVEDFFQIDGFKNCSEHSDRITRFLDRPLPLRQIHDDPDLFAAGFQIPYIDGLRPEVVWQFNATPWRYVCSATTNNPGKFDLWIELRTKSQTFVIGNWKGVE